MVKVLSFSFQQCFSPFSMLLVEGSPETRLFYLTTHFRGRKFENTSAMRVIYCLKIFEIECKFRKCKKIIERIFFVSEITASKNVAINCLY